MVPRKKTHGSREGPREKILPGFTCPACVRLYVRGLPVCPVFGPHDGVDRPRTPRSHLTEGHMEPWKSASPRRWCSGLLQVRAHPTPTGRTEQTGERQGRLLPLRSPGDSVTPQGKVSTQTWGHSRKERPGRGQEAERGLGVRFSSQSEWSGYRSSSRDRDGGDLSLQGQRREGGVKGLGLGPRLASLLTSLVLSCVWNGNREDQAAQASPPDCSEEGRLGFD